MGVPKNGKGKSQKWMRTGGSPISGNLQTLQVVELEVPSTTFRLRQHISDSPVVQDAPLSGWSSRLSLQSSNRLDDISDVIRMKPTNFTTW